MSPWESARWIFVIFEFSSIHFHLIFSSLATMNPSTTVASKDIVLPRPDLNTSSKRKVCYYPNDPADAECDQVMASPRYRTTSEQLSCARHYAGKLALLIHAKQCLVKQSANEEAQVSACRVKHCLLAQHVLLHVVQCSLDSKKNKTRKTKCSHPSCRETQILLRHYRVHRTLLPSERKSCLLCLTLDCEYGRESLPVAKRTCDGEPDDIATAAQALMALSPSSSRCLSKRFKKCCA